MSDLDPTLQAFLDDIKVVNEKHKKMMVPVIRKIPTKDGLGWYDEAAFRIMDVTEEPKEPEINDDTILDTVIDEPKV